MLPFYARNNSQGFTILEILIVLIIIGTLSAIAVPSYLGTMSKAKVNDAVTKVRGAFQEAQREAIRKSKSCTVMVPNGNNQTLTSSCFVTENRTLTNINIKRDNSQQTVTFNFKGIVTAGGSETQAIVFSLSDGTPTQQKCLIISDPLGLIKIGKYSSATGTDASNCAISQ